MKNILFSCVSDADPVGPDGYDGPLLHIVRVYRPECVYLFFTKTFLDLDEKYHGIYEKCIKEVCPECEAFRCEDMPDIKVQSFDSNFQRYCQTEFQQIVRKYQCLCNHGHNENDNICRLLVNVTSGTPQMQMAMGIAIVFMPKEYNIQPIQVERREYFKKKPREFVLPMISLDDDPYFKDRTVEPTFGNVVSEFNKEQIEDFIGKYDFNAALSFVKKVIGNRTDDASEIVLACLSELIAKAELNLQEAEKFEKIIAGYKDREPDEKKKRLFDLSNPENLKGGEPYSKPYLLFSYMQAVSIKKQRKDIDGFFMQFSVLFVHLTAYYLENVFEIPLGADGGQNIEELEKACPDVFDYLSGRRNEKNPEKFQATSSFLFNVLQAFQEQRRNFTPAEAKDFDKVFARGKSLRGIDRNIRNSFAHDLTSRAVYLQGRTKCVEDDGNHISIDEPSRQLNEYAKIILNLPDNFKFLHNITKHSDLIKYELGRL